MIAPRRIRGALTLAALLALAALAVTGPATAQTTAPKLRGAVTSPQADAELEDPIVGTNGYFEYDSSSVLNQPKVTEITITVEPGRGQPVPDNATYRKASPQAQRMDFSWTTPPLLANGPYTFKAVAKGTSAGQTESLTLTRSFVLVAPPARPTGLKGRPSVDDGSVTLTWDANPEVDLLGYVVQRSSAGADDFDVVADVVENRYVDHPEPGTWRYQVVAVRSGATEEEGVASEPSEARDATLTRPTTTTSAAGGNSEPRSSSSTTAPRNEAVSEAGKVDLSNFDAILNANRARPPTTTTTADPGFGERLPFAGGTIRERVESEGDAVAAPNMPLEIDEGSPQSLAWIAAALLFLVLALVLRFLRGQGELAAAELVALEPAPAVEPHGGDRPRAASAALSTWDRPASSRSDVPAEARSELRRRRAARSANEPVVAAAPLDGPRPAAPSRRQRPQPARRAAAQASASHRPVGQTRARRTGRPQRG